MISNFTLTVLFVTAFFLSFPDLLKAEAGGVCGRCFEVRAALSKKFGLHCSEITPERLFRVDDLFVDSEDDSGASKGEIFEDCTSIDFIGLPNLKKLRLKQRYHLVTPMPKNFFGSLPQLESLSYEADGHAFGNAIPDSDALSGLAQLNSLSIRGLPSLPKNFLSPVSKTLKHLWVSVETVPGDLLEGLAGLETLRLAGDGPRLREDFFTPTPNLLELQFAVQNVKMLAREEGFTGLNSLRKYSDGNFARDYVSREGSDVRDGWTESIAVDGPAKPIFNRRATGNGSCEELTEKLMEVKAKYENEFKAACAVIRRRADPLVVGLGGCIWDASRRELSQGIYALGACSR